MEEIKIGEYVRTKDGYLAKCINSHKYALDFDNTIRTSYGETWEYLLPEDTNHIKAHSFDIIDLIEVGDIVEVEDMGDNRIIHINDDRYLKDFKGYIANGYFEVKSLLTHEQFENMKYVVGDK